jgi:hypothetical protein
MGWSPAIIVADFYVGCALYLYVHVRAAKAARGIAASTSTWQGEAKWREMARQENSELILILANSGKKRENWYAKASTTKIEESTNPPWHPPPPPPTSPQPWRRAKANSKASTMARTAAVVHPPRR